MVWAVSREMISSARLAISAGSREGGGVRSGRRAWVGVGIVEWEVGPG